MQEYEAALAAQRERVRIARRLHPFGAKDFDAALDAYGKLAATVQAASATAENHMAWDHAHEALAAIIRELEGVESQA